MSVTPTEGPFQDIAQELYTAAEFRNQLLGRALDVIGELESDVVELLADEKPASRKPRRRRGDASLTKTAVLNAAGAYRRADPQGYSLDRSFMSTYSRATFATATSFMSDATVVEEALLQNTEQRTTSVRRAYQVLSTLKTDLDSLLYELDKSLSLSGLEPGDAPGAATAASPGSRRTTRNAPPSRRPSQLTAAALSAADAADKAVLRRTTSGFTFVNPLETSFLSESFMASLPEGGDVMKEAVATSTAASRFRTRAGEVAAQAAKAKEMATQRVRGTGHTTNSLCM